MSGYRFIISIYIFLLFHDDADGTLLYRFSMNISFAIYAAHAFLECLRHADIHRHFGASREPTRFLPAFDDDYDISSGSNDFGNFSFVTS